VSAQKNEKSENGAETDGVVSVVKNILEQSPTPISVKQLIKKTKKGLKASGKEITQLPQQIATALVHGQLSPHTLISWKAAA